jgi:hypothetical protein
MQGGENILENIIKMVSTFNRVLCGFGTLLVIFLPFQ